MHCQLRPCPALAPCKHPRCPAAPRRPTEPRRPAEPRRPTELHCPARAAPAATAASAATAATAATAAMASPTVLTFDAEGRAVDFHVWVDDLQLFLQCDSKDGVSFFDHTSGVSPAPAATADIARYSSPATAAQSRLMLPYLFPDLAAFATVADLITHLRTSDARYRAALPTESVPLSPYSPVLLLLLLSTSLARRSGLRLLLVGGAAPTRARRARVVEGTVGAAVEAVEEAEGVAVEVGVVAGVGASVAAVGVVEAAAEAVEAAAAVVEVATAVVLVEVEPRSVEALVVASTSSSRVPVRPRRPSSFNVAIFDLDFNAILAAMYAVTDAVEGDCYLCIPPDSGIEAAALGASASTAPGTSESAAPGTSESAAPGAGESALSGTAPIEALHTFTLDSGASRSFFRDSTTLTPLCRPVAVSLADPSGGPVLAHSSTVLPCPAAPSGLMSGLQLPSFSANLVSGADLQDAWVDQFTLGGQRVTHCTCSRTGRHLATFTRRPGSSLYKLTIEPPLVTSSGQVATSGQVFAAASRSSPVSAPCSCRPLSHETLLWHHRLGHPSLPRLQGMASRTLVSCLPWSLPPLPPRPTPTCVPCVEGRQCATPHSFEFPPTEAPLQTLHMDVWGPARVSGQGHERYFLLVVDDYSRYTTVFPLCRKDRGGEFSSNLLRAFCRVEGIHQTFTLLASPQQNGIAELRIGMPRVSLPETTPTLRWTGKVGDASEFRVWGSRAFVHDTSADKLSSRPVPCVFLGFPPDAPGWQFYQPTSRRVLSSQDVTFDESVSYYHPVEPVEVAVDSSAARGAKLAGGAVPWVAESEGAEPRGAELECVEPGGAEPGGAEPERAESGGPPGLPSRREPLSPQRLCEWYAQRCSRAAGATGPTAGGDSRVGAAGGAAGAGAAGAAGAGGTGAVGGPTCVGAAGGTGAAGTGGARTGGNGATAANGAAGVGAVGAGAVATGGAAGAGAVGAGAVATEGVAGVGAAGGTGAGGAAGVVAGDPGAEGPGAVSAVSRGAARPRPYYVPLLQQVLGLPPSTGPPPPLLSPPHVQSQSQLQPASPLPGPSPYSGPTRGLTERREPESRPASPESRPASPESCLESPVCTGHRFPRQRPPPVPGTHSMTLHPSTAPQRVPLPSPPASSLPEGPDPKADSLHAASPTVLRFLATAVTDPLFESTTASALVAELVDFAAACRLDYATSLVAESEQEEFECFAAALPHLVSMLLAPEGDPDALDIPTPRSYAEAIEGPYSSQWQTAMDTEMASWNSTGTYVDEVPPPGANIVSGMWIFRVKRPPGSPPVFKARYLARGFNQRQGVDFFQTFSPTPSRRVTLHEAPCEWHDTPRTTLAALGFAPSTADPSLFLRTDTTLPPFYVLVYVDDLVFATADTEALAHVKSELQKRHTCTDLAPPSDESVEPSGSYPELVGCLIHRKEHMDAAKRVLRYLCSTLGMGLVLGGRARVVLTGHADASWVDDLATQRSSQGYTFSLGSGSVSWRSTHSSSVLSSSCEAEIYAGAIAAQELRWLTYLLIDLGEAPRSPPVLYVDNKAMLALCQEYRLEHRTKHIALRYFLARELQQRGQLRLAYVASQANTADIFTKALQPCDHQCFCTMLGLVPTWPHLLTS
ncbi:unnamed protein product [Closterium sp. NIES-53]